MPDIYFTTAGGDRVAVSATNPLPISDSGAVQAGTVGQPGGPAGPLDAQGHIPADQLPPQPLHETFEAADEATMLAAPVSAPAVCIRTDFTPPHLFYLHTDPASTLGNWEDLGAGISAGGDPSAQVGLTPTNGVAATYMRSDGAPALDQSIVPTWTGQHTFNAETTHAAAVHMGEQKIVNIGDGTDPRDAVNRQQLDTKVTTPDPLIAKVVLGTTLSTNVLGMVGYDQDVLGDTLVMRRFSGAVAGATAAQTDELVTLAQLNAAIAGIGTQSDLGTPQTHASVDVFLTQSSPTVQLIDTTPGDVLVNLPPAAQVTAGKRYIIKRLTTAGNGLDIQSGDTNGALIDGVESIGIADQYSLRELVFDGTHWQIIGTAGS